MYSVCRSSTEINEKSIASGVITFFSETSNAVFDKRAHYMITNNGMSWDPWKERFLFVSVFNQRLVCGMIENVLKPNVNFKKKSISGLLWRDCCTNWFSNDSSCQHGLQNQKLQLLLNLRRKQRLCCFAFSGGESTEAFKGMVVYCLFLCHLWWMDLFFEWMMEGVGFLLRGGGLAANSPSNQQDQSFQKVQGLGLWRVFLRQTCHLSRTCPLPNPDVDQSKNHFPSVRFLPFFVYEFVSLQWNVQPLQPQTE